MADSLILVAFYGATLQAVLVNGIPHVCIRSICDALGLDFAAQRQRMLRHPVLASTMVVTTTVAEDGKAREMLCLPLDMLNGWLFGVSVARVRPELRGKLLQYQRECFEVLARHFGAAPALPAPPALPAVEPECLSLQRISEVAVAVGARARKAAHRHLMAGHAGDGPRRLLFEFCVDKQGELDAFGVTLAPDAVIGTWAEIADKLRLEPECIPQGEVMGLAEAATSAAFCAAANSPKGAGEEIAEAIHKAGDELALSDLQKIATTAAHLVWRRVLAHHNGRAGTAASSVKRLVPVAPKGVKAKQEPTA